VLFTCHPSFHESVLAAIEQKKNADGARKDVVSKYASRMRDEIKNRVVFCNNCVTSQGPGTAIEFAITLVNLLCGADTASKVAAPLCAWWLRPPDEQSNKL